MCVIYLPRMTSARIHFDDSLGDILTDKLWTSFVSLTGFVFQPQSVPLHSYIKMNKSSK